jgi:hypothetical protein
MIVLLLVTSGCSSFNRDWRRAATQAEPPTGMAGRWEGRWWSDYNGHNGKLRCLITPLNEHEYAARFRASYLAVLRFEYTVTLQTIPTADGWIFRGEADLGKVAGGVYQYDGTITAGTNFHSAYRASVDHGFFQMQKRP